MIIRELSKACIIAVRPLLGPASCRFYPSCTNYALKQLNTKKWPLAWKSIFIRLLACRPFTKQ